MGLRRTGVVAAAVASVAAFSQGAAAGAALPDARTHIDPSTLGAMQSGTANPDAPRLTLLEPATRSNDLRRGLLYVRARCDARCVVSVTARATVEGERVKIASAKKTLPAGKVRRIRLRIDPEVRRRLAPGTRIRYVARPRPAL